MISLQALTEQQVRRYLNVSPEQFEYLRNPSPDHLHDPFYYRDMRELAMHLHRFWQKQQEDEKLLLIVDGDYDADGIYAAVILAAALDVFGFRFRVHIPTMADGYGMSRKSIDDMKRQQEKEGYKIGMILTADQGIKAFSAIEYAKSLGIQILVTDHHPGDKKLPKALAVVDPNRVDDLYPFKGNSGACVAWKAMLAYAGLFAKEKQPLIERLIVFAGLSNVADVMPILDENRYTVTAAMSAIKEILSKSSYQAIADTPYPQYNAVFHALYDIITLLQESKDVKRVKKGKKPIPLPTNEELFGWYLGPMLNAPRRVHDTCLEGLASFLVTDVKTRHMIIRRLIELNEEKSKLRDKVVEALPETDLPTVLCINMKKGIAGLIAEKVYERTGLPSVVFSYEDAGTEELIYQGLPNTQRVSGSARSGHACPLDRIMEKINQKCPGLVSGGGHAQAAGFSIETKNLNTFRNLMDIAISEVMAEVAAETEITVVPENRIWIALTKNAFAAVYQTKEPEETELTVHTELLNQQTFGRDVLETIKFFDTLRPFGKDFEAQTRFTLVFDQSVYDHGWNSDFWKTFKFNLFGAEVLTFDEKWAEEVKQALNEGKRITASAKLNRNEFRGTITPQLILSPEKE